MNAEEFKLLTKKLEWERKLLNHLFKDSLAAMVMINNHREILEKSVLLHEVHHRVKNNLALLTALLNLQKRSMENSELEQILN